MRALATTGRQRASILPDVPTVAQTGYPELEFAEWFGILVPAKTPAETVNALAKGSSFSMFRYPAAGLQVAKCFTNSKLANPLDIGPRLPLPPKERIT